MGDGGENSGEEGEGKWNIRGRVTAYFSIKKRVVVQLERWAHVDPNEEWYSELYFAVATKTFTFHFPF